ncbi:methyltransferase [Streptomyces phage Braelyn]|uniref:Methyltransferase n=1 Tax=Streptomyces phage Braelyn TaxID=2593356 RepID=A0A514U1W6_9CAUD|nr:methyltransferase [Streptomyces phage Braelyn]QDK02948.1 methyltransferase [Streptomyces phage Braelyn]
MKYFSRDDVEKIGRAGAMFEEDEHGIRFRMLGSFWMYAEDDDEAMTPHFKNGLCYWESWVTKYISERVPTGAIFVDVGANVGYYSLWAAAHGCEVVAFEPNKHLVQMIENSAKANGFYIEVMPWALSDKNGKMNLYVPEHHSGAASLHHKLGKKTSVRVQKLDESYGFEPGSDVYIKIDAEGAEPFIWAGMQKTWETCNVVVFMEWSNARYSETFGHRLLDEAKVSLIEYDGTARELTEQELLGISDIRMIVLERK